MIHTEIYASAVVEVNELISTTIEDFSDLVIKLSMSGEFADVDDLFDEGDEVILSANDFIHTSDVRVQTIIKLMHGLRDARQMFLT